MPEYKASTLLLYLTHPSLEPAGVDCLVVAVVVAPLGELTELLALSTAQTSQTSQSSQLPPFVQPSYSLSLI